MVARKKVAKKKKATKKKVAKKRKKVTKRKNGKPTGTGSTGKERFEDDWEDEYDES